MRYQGMFVNVHLALLVFACFLLVAAHAHANGHEHDSDHYHSDIVQPKIAKVLHKCIHDELEAKHPIVKKSVDQNNFRFEDIGQGAFRAHRKRGDVWEALRVLVVTDNFYSDAGTCTSQGQTVQTSSGAYTCGSDDILTSDKITYLNTSMLQVAAARFQELLLVNRTYNRLDVGNNENSGCDSTNEVKIPQSILNNGADADFVLLVTARPIPTSDPNSRTLAYARTCKTLASTGRPILGWANFDPGALEPNDDNQLGQQVGVAIHEISHSLGFNLGAWISQGMVTADGSNYRMTHPLIQDYVRTHFNCPTLTGALLENDGGSGTAGSHWEKAAFMNEYMTGTAASNPVITKLTMLSFVATGWYQSDYTKTDSLVFGLGAGCGMSEDWTGCDQWPSDYKCDALTGTVSKCTADRAGYGPCVQEPSSGSIIGSGCMYHGASTTCVFPFPPNSAQAIAKAGNSAFSSSGQSFAADSRCFMSTLNKITSLSDIVPIPAPSAPKCFRVTCSAPNEPRLSVDSIWYPCYPSGTNIEATGFGGAITCPASSGDWLCQERGYDADWPRIMTVSPAKSKPGTDITIDYTGAANDTGITIVVETDTTNPRITANGSVTVTLAGDDAWGSPKYLNLFKTKLNVIIKDSQGRSDVQYDSFQVDIGFGLAYLKALWAWMKKNPLFATLACIAIAIPIIIAIFCCYRKCCRKKKAKPQRTQYRSTYDRQADAYYYDEELDDMARHKPPRSIV